MGCVQNTNHYTKSGGEPKSDMIAKKGLHLYFFISVLSVKWNLNDKTMHYRLNIMENVATALVFVIVVVNVFITAFGVQQPHRSG